MKLVRSLSILTLATLGSLAVESISYATEKAPLTFRDRLKHLFACTHHIEDDQHSEEPQNVIETPCVVSELVNPVVIKQKSQLEKLDLDSFDYMAHFLDPESLDHLSHASHSLESTINQVKPLLNKTNLFKTINESELMEIKS